MCDDDDFVPIVECIAGMQSNATLCQRMMAGCCSTDCHRSSYRLPTIYLSAMPASTNIGPKDEIFFTNTRLRWRALFFFCFQSIRTLFHTYYIIHIGIYVSCTSKLEKKDPHSRLFFWQKTAKTFIYSYDTMSE